MSKTLQSLRLEKELSTTPGMWQEFVTSAIWGDFVGELDVWIGNILNELAKTSFDHESGKMEFTQDQRVLYDEMLRGCLLALERVKQLPYVIIEHSQASRENN